MIRLPHMRRFLFVAGVLALVLSSIPARAAVPVQERYASDEALRHFLAGRWLEATGDLPGAGAEYARAIALDPEALEPQLAACSVAARAAEPQRALELAHGVLARDPGNARALWLEGAALVSLSRTAEAVRPLTESVRIDSLNTECWRTLAHAADELERPALAESCYSHLVALDEDDSENWFQLATLRARLGRYAEADSALTVALDDNPTRPGATFLRGWLRERLGQPEEAVALYADHLRVHPGDHATRRRLVGLLARLGRYHEALPHAREVARAQADDPGAWQVLADLEFRDGRPADAEKSLERMRAIAPDDPDAIARSAEVLDAHGRAGEALALGDAWAARRPNDLHVLALRAMLREQAGRLDSALALARLAAAGAPDSAIAQRLLARYLRLTQRWPEAIDVLTRLRERAPADVSVLMDLGFCREQSGDIDGAVAAGRDAIAIAPDDAASLNFLGFILADHGRDLAEAEPLIRRALAQEPDNGAYVDSMGWLLFRRGDLDGARQALERALALTGGDPVIHEHLGDVYMALRQPERAREQYRLSLDGDTRNARVRGKFEAAR